MAHDGQGRSITIVGGGLAGLAAATYLARAGHRVTVCERAPALGGRAATHASAGYLFNLGPHALYRKAEGASVLAELGVTYTGKTPSAAGGFALARGTKHALPGGFVSLLTTGLFGVAAKLETARVLATFGKIDAAPLATVSVRDWSERALRHPDVRRLVLALFRLATYGGAPEQQSAGAAIHQLQRALTGNVLYLDGGWQTLVRGLEAQATAAGATIRTDAGVARIEANGRVHLRDGGVLAADAVLVAAGPDVAADLVADGRAGALGRIAQDAVPVRAACLDVALRTLPVPGATFALGIDQPHYLSVHSAYAALAPTGGAVVHVARYLGADKPAGAHATERELEGVLDLVQPGWQAQVVERRFLPAMTVSHALPRAANGGLGGRPGPAVPQMPRLYVAGDWVGDAGMLADASLASARRAAALITERLATSAAA
jgi:phytoene dehydrogenase-like protein